MNAHGPEPKSDKLRGIHWIVYGLVAGPIAVGMGGLTSLIIYGSSDPTAHLVSVVVIVACGIAAGCLGSSLLNWMIAKPFWFTPRRDEALAAGEVKATNSTVSAVSSSTSVLQPSQDAPGTTSRSGGDPRFDSMRRDDRENARNGRRDD